MVIELCFLPLELARNRVQPLSHFQKNRRVRLSSFHLRPIDFLPLKRVRILRRSHSALGKNGNGRNAPQSIGSRRRAVRKIARCISPFRSSGRRSRLTSRFIPRISSQIRGVGSLDATIEVSKPDRVTDTFPHSWNSTLALVTTRSRLFARALVKRNFVSINCSFVCLVILTSPANKTERFRKMASVNSKTLTRPR